MRSGKLALIALGIVLLGAVWFAYSVLDSYVNPEDTVVDEEVPQVEISDESNDTNSSGLSPENGSESETSELREGDESAVTQVTSQFQQGDSTYDIDGDLIVTRDGGEVTLSFADFSVTAGPDLFVYLVDTEDVSNSGVKSAVEAGNFVNLAELKGNIGGQNYSVTDVDIDEYNVVSVWCRQFGRNFGHAEFEL